MLVVGITAEHGSQVRRVVVGGKGRVRRQLKWLVFLITLEVAT